MTGDWWFVVVFVAVSSPAVAAVLVAADRRERACRAVMRQRLTVPVEVPAEVLAEINQARINRQAEQVLTKAFGPQPSNRTGE